MPVGVIQTFPLIILLTIFLIVFIIYLIYLYINDLENKDDTVIQLLQYMNSKMF